MVDRLDIHTFPGLTIRQNGKAVRDLASRKVEALLLYLAYHSRPQPREVLAELFWDELPAGRALRNLRVALSSIRKTFDGLVGNQQDPVALDARVEIWLDASIVRASFDPTNPDRKLLKGNISEIETILDLYQGEFLEGFHLRNARRVEAWITQERERLHQLVVNALIDLIRQEMENGAYPTGIAYAQRLLELAPLMEWAHRGLMRLYAYNGQRIAALSQFNKCRELLKAEFGVEPEDATLSLYEQLRSSSLAPPDTSGSLVDLIVPALPTFLLAAPASEVATNVIVARERHLEQLKEILSRAISGQGQVAFVTGEAGSGKTSLMRAFGRLSEDKHSDLIIATGSCSTHTKTGDPLLPFREILRTLTGEIETPYKAGDISGDQARRLWSVLPLSLDLLAKQGADLINKLVSSHELLARVKRMWGENDLYDRLVSIEEKEAAGDPEGRYPFLWNQFVDFIHGLASERPLVLILDDLQWADTSSIDLFFHLGRRLRGRRVLVLGAYRKEEVAIGRNGQPHPLAEILPEFKARFGDIWVQLDAESEYEQRKFVDAFLDLAPNRLDDSFRTGLVQQTKGNPLFTVELVHNMREHGVLIQDEEGNWFRSSEIDWGQSPARVEGVIELRTNRLPLELREFLDVASVEGELFSVQTLSNVLSLPEERVSLKLSQDLEKRHNLIEEAGLESADAKSLSFYRFRHALFHQFIYSRLSLAAKRIYHAKVGISLESLFEDELETIAGQLARHFQISRDSKRVYRYGIMAGDCARKLGAGREAEQFYLMALQEAADQQSEALPSPIFLIHEKLGDVYRISLSQEDKALRHYRMVLGSCKTDLERARTNRKIGSVYLLHGDLEKAEDHLKRAIEIHAELETNLDQSRAHNNLSALYIYQYDLSQAKLHAEKALELSMYLEDPDSLASAHKVLGVIAMEEGDLEKARSHNQLSLDIYRDVGDITRVTQAANNLGETCFYLGETEQAITILNEGLELAHEMANNREESMLLISLALLYVEIDQHEIALDLLSRAQPLAESTGVPIRAIQVHWISGQANLGLGQLSGARSALESALTLSEETRIFHHLAWIYLDLAKLAQYENRLDDVEDLLRVSREVIGDHASDLFQARISRQRASLAAYRGRHSEALDLLRQGREYLADGAYMIERGKNLLDAGRIHIQRGRSSDLDTARDVITQAKHIFSQIGADNHRFETEKELTRWK